MHLRGRTRTHATEQSAIRMTALLQECANSVLHLVLVHVGGAFCYVCVGRFTGEFLHVTQIFAPAMLMPTMTHGTKGGYVILPANWTKGGAFAFHAGSPRTVWAEYGEHFFFWFWSQYGEHYFFCFWRAVGWLLWCVVSALVVERLALASENGSGFLGVKLFPAYVALGGSLVRHIQFGRLCSEYARAASVWSSVLGGNSLHVRSVGGHATIVSVFLPHDVLPRKMWGTFSKGGDPRHHRY